MAIGDLIGPDADGNIQIASHLFSAVMFLYLTGRVSRNIVVNRLNLNAEDQIELDAIKIYYDGLTNLEKASFHGLIESLNILRSDNLINTQQYNNFLGLSILNS